MAIGTVLDGSGPNDMLADQCKCTQCGQNLSALSYQRRVAHVKRCEATAGTGVLFMRLHWRLIIHLTSCHSLVSIDS